jgi:hypothetical protein
VTIEAWLVLGAVTLLALAAGACSFRLFKGQSRWVRIAAGARVGAAGFLTMALVLSVAVQGGWSPVDQRQLALSVALVALCLHLVWTWRSRLDGAGPILDLLLLALLLAGEYGFPSDTVSTCVGSPAPFYAQWILIVLGVGAMTVAGSTSLLLALNAFFGGRGRDIELPGSADLFMFLRQAMGWALIFLGAGLTVSVWRAWRTLGLLTSGDPREAWLASTWLIGGASLLSWQLEQRRGRWALGLAVVAAVAAFVGLFAAVDLSYLLVI